MVKCQMFPQCGCYKDCTEEDIYDAVRSYRETHKPTLKTRFKKIFKDIKPIPFFIGVIVGYVIVQIIKHL